MACLIPGRRFAATVVVFRGDVRAVAARVGLLVAVAHRALLVRLLDEGALMAVGEFLAAVVALGVGVVDLLVEARLPVLLLVGLVGLPGLAVVVVVRREAGPAALRARRAAAAADAPAREELPPVGQGEREWFGGGRGGGQRRRGEVRRKLLVLLRGDAVVRLLRPHMLRHRARFFLEAHLLGLAHRVELELLAEAVGLRLLLGSPAGGFLFLLRQRVHLRLELPHHRHQSLHRHGHGVPLGAAGAGTGSRRGV